jgi:hypothetical protein
VGDAFREKVSDCRVKAAVDPIEFARCFLRLANLPNFALDRLSRYEATLWRQADRILFALDGLDRRNHKRECVAFILHVNKEQKVTEDIGNSYALMRC